MLYFVIHREQREQPKHGEFYSIWDSQYSYLTLEKGLANFDIECLQP